jgi:exodeoxyribonuclease X
MKAIVFDTETTGKFDPVLIEGAWLEIPSINPFSTGQSFCQRYNPGKLIELGALATHHIYDEELENCPSANTFFLPESVEYVIGHNIDYDWGVIGNPNVKRICTLALARRTWPELDAYSQSALFYFLDRQNARDILKNAHSAATDVEVCAKILRAICEKIQVHSFEQLWERSEVARVPIKMPFGKHKGELIKDIPADYRRWLVSQTDLDPYLVKALMQ